MAAATLPHRDGPGRTTVLSPDLQDHLVHQVPQEEEEEEEEEEDFLPLLMAPPAPTQAST